MSDLVAVDVLDHAGVAYRLHRHAPVVRAQDHANSGLALELSAKTLAFTVAERPVLVCLPGAEKLGYGQLARALDVARSQLKAASTETLERLGMRPGGVCPFTPAGGVRVVIDPAVLELPVIYCGAGDPQATIEITPGELRRACPDAIIAKVTGPKE